MKHIFGKRCSGKTTEMFKYCREEDAYFVTTTTEMKKVFIFKAKAEGYEDLVNKIITYEEYIRSPWIKRVVIDEMGSFMSWLFHGDIVAYSETIEDESREDFVVLETRYRA